MADVTKYYEMAADGKFYLVLEDEDGNPVYEPADESLNLVEIGKTGKFIEARDLAELAKQRAADSHKDYFEDPTKAKQRMKSQEALARQLDVLSTDMRVPPTGPNVRYIKDEEFLELRKTYEKAHAVGQERDCDFQPLSSYHHKLTTKSGTIIRPVFQGEVGMEGHTILCLEEGYGKGTMVVGGLDAQAIPEGE